MYDKDKKIYIYKVDINKGKFLRLTSCDVETWDDGTYKYKLQSAYIDKGTQKTRTAKKRCIISIYPYEVIIRDGTYVIWFYEPKENVAKRSLLTAIKKQQKETEKILNNINNIREELERG